MVGTIAVLKKEDGKSVLKRMFVDKEYRGIEKDVSKRLLEIALGWCEQEGITSIFLGTMNQFKGAHRFYEKNDFQKDELRKGFLQNPIDDIFYKKSLRSKKMPEDGLSYRAGNTDDLEIAGPTA